jgi:general L-amino acid transport system substrate-binding protein
MPTTGGLYNALHSGAAIDCDAVQLFTASPRQWASKPLTSKEIRNFRRAVEATGIDPLIAHDSYLINLATSDEALKAYDSGRCDAYTTDASGLYSERLRTVNPDEHMVLPEIISKEPLGPAVRKGDDQWYDIVRWTHFAMINAEELGVAKANVDEKAKSATPEIKRLLGSEGDFGKAMGLSKDWAYRIIKHVGNYGEVFEKNVGEGSRLKIRRGLNNLWTKGGIQYAPPVR